MPLSDEYRDNIKGEVADLRNSAGRMGSAINGAAFIEAGVEPHRVGASDIASSGWSEEDRPYSPKGAQGVAVRTLVELARRLARLTTGLLKKMSPRQRHDLIEISATMSGEPLHRGNQLRDQ